jgi:hypothetical protein
MSGSKIQDQANKPKHVEDPHPSNEEHYDRIKHPGGASPPKNDLGPNPHIHSGGIPRRPSERRALPFLT